MEINYKKCTYDELLQIIRDCQKELDNRGTITNCRNVFFKNKEHTIFITNEPCQTSHNNDYAKVSTPSHES